ncbi:MAG: thiolase family protein [Verrucomicrobiales bacterium]|nr:thiolase family protein [Verrucomicrobiales bacterium]
MSLVIIDGIRTPFSKLGSSLASVDAVELGRIAVSALLARTGFDPEQVDETIFGCVSQPFDAANIARVIALRAGIPKSKPAMTVHRNCASSLESLTTAAERAAAGHGEVFIVGGTESMSRVPLLFSAAAAAKFAALARAKTWGGKAAAALSFRPRDFSPVIGLRLGLTDPVVSMGMGETAEVIAREYGVTRAEQDAFALASHQRAAAAREILREEMCPAYVPGAKGGFVLDDNGVRDGQSLAALAKLPPAFEKNTGTVTAGNSSQLTDGAVAMLVMTEARAEKLGLTPLGRLIDHAYAGCDPARMGLGPAYAIRKLAERCGLKPADADVIEINEAFAAQVLAVVKLMETPDFAAAGLQIPVEKLNPNGGAIALGHPVGASGGRLVLTALKQLHRTGGKRALCSACIGGGQGGAVWVERP